MGVVEKKHGSTEVPERDPFTKVFFSALTGKGGERWRERGIMLVEQQNQNQIQLIVI